MYLPIKMSKITAMTFIYVQNKKREMQRSIGKASGSNNELKKHRNRAKIQFVHLQGEQTPIFSKCIRVAETSSSAKWWLSRSKSCLGTINPQQTLPPSQDRVQKLFCKGENAFLVCEREDRTAVNAV